MWKGKGLYKGTIRKLAQSETGSPTVTFLLTWQEVPHAPGKNPASSVSRGRVTNVRPHSSCEEESRGVVVGGGKKERQGEPVSAGGRAGGAVGVGGREREGVLKSERERQGRGGKGEGERVFLY